MQAFKKIFLFFTGLIFTLAFLFFAMVNRETVTLDLTPLPYTLELRLFVFASLLVLFGIMLGWLVASFECRKRYLIHKDMRKQIALLQEENSNLRMQQSQQKDSFIPVDYSPLS